MIVIIRMQSQKEPDLLWNEILAKKDELQVALGNKGKLLYLSKRRNYKEASLFLHIADSNILGYFIAEHLAKIPGVDNLWFITLLKPMFYPLVPEAREMKRYTITIKAYPPRLGEVYKHLTELKSTPDIKPGYVAYTFHLFGDCLQVSLSAKEEPSVQRYVNETISSLPGILRTTVCEIEKTHPFVSYKEWQQYTVQHTVLMEWDEQCMVEQFQV